MAVARPHRAGATWLVRPLPPALEPLARLSLDLRWTWSHATDHLWAMLDPVAWERTVNPWLMLQTVPQQRLEELAADPDFTSELARLEAARLDCLNQPSWCARNLPAVRDCTVAYFSMEYGLGEALPIYSGGLGVLAGDHLKTASDRGLPLVAIGLLYQQGYFRQVLDAEGGQLCNPTTLQQICRSSPCSQRTDPIWRSRSSCRAAPCVCASGLPGSDVCRSTCSTATIP